ncbi:MAG: cobalt-precorrin-5B (C(1))-methyltransferase [Alphaproteobacteria bacterium]|nr:cobalt-precorrin-5B (C(1))-methyltransferase [Alphaproteobacteria bacterium]
MTVESVSESAADSGSPLRTGWTTGACAAAAALAATEALSAGDFADAVEVVLPRGERARFAVAHTERGDGWRLAGVVKDAGDDPDVTHGALICARAEYVSRETETAAAAMVSLCEGRLLLTAGEGVGVVTCPGLPVAVGEPAINPGPRKLLAETLSGHLAALGREKSLHVRISVPDGAALAKKTWNGRLGIEGGISILGTTGIVRPYSCAAWIASIHRGVDVARALGHSHVAGSTGSVSEAAVRELYGLPETALLDMGDFAGGMLKYLRQHPIPRLTLAGGFAKLTKLGQGAGDLHSARSEVSLSWLSERARESGADDATAERVAGCRSAAEVLSLGIEGLASEVARHARAESLRRLRGAAVSVETVVVSRGGEVLGRADE